MKHDVHADHFVIIAIEGLHCHKCEQAIRKAMHYLDGVHEVEVDFASGQASVLYDRAAVSIRELLEAVRSAGYKTNGFTQRNVDPAPYS